jgi:hypothetical protein
MDNKYKIKLEVRDKSSEFGADSVTELLLFMATGLFSMDLLTSQANTPSGSTQDSNDAAAQRLIEAYHTKFNKTNNRHTTPIFRAGKEIDLASCYLARMTTVEAIKWLGKHRSFKTSVSAVGRYFRGFAQLPTAVKIA